MKSTLVWPVGIVAFVVLLAMAYCQGTQRGDRSSAVDQAKQAIKTADSARAIAIREVVRVDTQLVDRVRTVTRTLAHTDTVRDSVLLHLTDTVRVREFVAQADTAIRACRDVVQSCQAFRTAAFNRFAADSSSIARRDSLLKLPAPRPHWGLGLGLGYACNPRGCGPGLALGVSWRW